MRSFVAGRFFCMEAVSVSEINRLEVFGSYPASKTTTETRQVLNKAAFSSSSPIVQPSLELMNVTITSVPGLSILNAFFLWTIVWLLCTPSVSFLGIQLNLCSHLVSEAVRRGSYTLNVAVRAMSILPACKPIFLPFCFPPPTTTDMQLAERPHAAIGYLSPQKAFLRTLISPPPIP